MEKILNLIENSEDSNFTKIRMKSFVNRANEAIQEHQSDMNLISEVGHERKAFEIILSTDEIKVYKTLNTKGEIVNEYPYKFIYKNLEGKWVNSHTISPSFDVTLLSYLEEKYCGLNSQFSLFASRMLGIKI